MQMTLIEQCHPEPLSKKNDLLARSEVLESFNSEIMILSNATGHAHRSCFWDQGTSTMETKQTEAWDTHTSHGKYAAASRSILSDLVQQEYTVPSFECDTLTAVATSWLLRHTHYLLP